MAKKSKGNDSPTGVVDDHGLCVEEGCGKIVDVVVSAWQVAGKGALRCIECEIKKIKAKAKADIEALQDKAEAAREVAREQVLPGLEEGGAE